MKHISVYCNNHIRSKIACLRERERERMNSLPCPGGFFDAMLILAREFVIHLSGMQLLERERILSLEGIVIFYYLNLPKTKQIKQKNKIVCFCVLFFFIIFILYLFFNKFWPDLNKWNFKSQPKGQRPCTSSPVALHAVATHGA